MLCQETDHSVFRPYKCFAHFRSCNIAGGKDESCRLEPDKSFAFKGSLSDQFILGENHPTAFSDYFKPFSIGTVFREMIVVDFNAETVIRQDARDYFLSQ